MRFFITVFICLNLTGLLCAQNERPLRELVTLNTNSSVQKKLRNVASYLKEKEWEPAFKIMQQVSQEQGDSLIRIRSQHYIPVLEYCQRMIAGLPQEGLTYYRKQVDAHTKTWYQNARKNKDIRLLHKILKQSYASSISDKALLLLGEYAWERDEPAIARYYWEQLIPLPYKVAAGVPLPLLRYPDSRISQAEIMSRLILCSLAEGNDARAQLELNVFKKRFPNTQGTIAGQTGLLSQLLTKEIKKEEHWQPVKSHALTQTFAGNIQRNRTVAKQVDIGFLQWKISLPFSAVALLQKKKGMFFRKALSSHPVVFKKIIFVNGDESIYAYHSKTGLPWPNIKDHSPLFSLAENDRELQPATLSLPVVGIPRHTMTVHQGYLYAKLGSPVTSRPFQNQQLNELNSKIVCLDLEKGEGKLVWKVSAKVLQKKVQEEWAFEGAPIVYRNHLYVATRRGTPHTEAGIACFHKATGKLIWHQKVCSTVNLVAGQQSFISHNLLTYGNQTIFYSTNLGAVIAIDATDGTTKWAMTYRSQRPKKISKYNSDAYQSLTPCLYYQGIVIAAPNDSGKIFAIDAPTGRLLWEQTLRGGTEQLLGIGKHGTLIASGKRLYGIDVLSGKIRWQLGYEDPLGQSYGRGLLAGDVIYWSLREEIVVVKQFSKDKNYLIVQRIPLKKLHGETGGNLSILNNQLLIAQP
ncbi:hypothetical protein MNBD_PLANCTO02-2543, partial [hydrothermal vent metagenome]